MYTEQEGTNIYILGRRETNIFSRRGGQTFHAGDGGGDNDVDGGQEEDVSEEAPLNFY